jgi:hypothetical protein
MDRRLALVVLVVGLVLALVAGLANPLGIGGSTDKFGWKQGIGLGVGIVIALAGVAMLMRVPSGPPPPGPPPPPEPPPPPPEP